MSVSRPPSSPGTTRARRRTGATRERGNGKCREHAGAKGASSVRAPAWGTPPANGATRGVHAPRYTRPPTSPPMTRRSSAHAPQRAGASQRKVAMSAPVQKGVIDSSSSRALAAIRLRRRPRCAAHRRARRDARAHRDGRRRCARRCGEGITSRASASRTRSNDATGDAHARQYTRPPVTPAATRRPSANAPQRAGASRWKVAMSATA